MTAPDNSPPAIVQLVEKHLALWSEPDPEVRLSLIAEVYSRQIRIVSVAEEVVGHEAVNEYISQQQANYPGYTFRASKPVAAHHEAALLTWECGPQSMPDAVTGVDVFQILFGKILVVTIFANE